MWPFRKKDDVKKVEEPKGTEESVDPKAKTRRIVAEPSENGEDTRAIERDAVESQKDLASVKASVSARQERVQKLAQEVCRKIEETSKVRHKKEEENE